MHDLERHMLRKAVLDAVDRLSSHQALRLPLDSTATAAVKNNIKVFPPRQRMSKRKEISQPGPSIVGISKDAVVGKSNRCNQLNPDTLRPPEFSSNAALALAAAERRTNRHPKCQNENRHISTDAVLQGAGASESITRQMSLANALCDCLATSLKDVADVCVSNPGFLNFRLQSSDSDPEPSPSRDDDTMNLEKATHADLREAMHLCRQKPRSKNGTSLVATLEVSDVSEMEAIGNPPILNNASHQSMEVVQPANISKSQRSVPAEGAMKDCTDGTTFSMELVPARFDAESYEIYRKYQITVHRERPSRCGEEAYRSFLVDSPLVQSRSTPNQDRLYGSYHMLYRLSGRLFAVGVLDVLPNCLSSVYLFYDPDFAKLSPGTLSALKEIEWIKKNADIYPSLRFYYMGYYIHSCPKMRYKANYHPSELLCEETKLWVPSTAAQDILDLKGQHAIRLSPRGVSPAAGAANFRFGDDIDDVANESQLQISLNHNVTRVVSLRTLERLLRYACPEQVEIIRERVRTFVRLVGRTNHKFYLHIV